MDVYLHLLYTIRENTDKNQIKIKHGERLITFRNNVLLALVRINTYLGKSRNVDKRAFLVLYISMHYYILFFFHPESKTDHYHHRRRLRQIRKVCKYIPRVTEYHILFIIIV